MTITSALNKSAIDQSSDQLDSVQAVISNHDFNSWFGTHQILKDININFQRNSINCLIGPSGSGKSTLIRSLNRINDEVSDYHTSGKICLHGKNILSDTTDVVQLRSQIGMVFQKPCVFPKSISENVLFGVQRHKNLSPNEKKIIIENNLKAVSLWDEVSQRLDERASVLSLGQQQRLCIARSLAVQPKILLLDEPTSSLDPVSTRAIENLLLKIKGSYTIIMVTHNIQQAQRISDKLIFICKGKIIEQGTKDALFSSPKSDLTAKYLNEEYCDC